MNYRKLTENEVAALESQACSAVDWAKIDVSEDFSTEFVKSVRFSGDIRLGSFRKEFTLPGGMKKHSGLYHATLHNVTICLLYTSDAADE